VKAFFFFSGIWRSVVETDSNRFMVSLFVCQIDLPISFLVDVWGFRSKSFCQKFSFKSSVATKLPKLFRV
jgi:hypothetical protein